MCLVGYCAIKENQKEQQKATINSYSALLQDTLSKITKNGDTVWLQGISSITPEDVYNSEIYNALSEENKQLVKELKKNKNLLLALTININGIKEENQKLKDSLRWYVVDTTFMARDGTILNFIDSVGSFQYNEEISLSDTIKRKVMYNLNITPKLEITKINKYSVQAQWEIPGLNSEFPNLTLLNGYSYYQMSEKEKRKQNLKKYGLISLNLVEDALLIYGSYKLGQITNMPKR